MWPTAGGNANTRTGQEEVLALARSHVAPAYGRRLFGYTVGSESARCITPGGHCVVLIEVDLDEQT